VLPADLAGLTNLLAETCPLRITLNVLFFSLFCKILIHFNETHLNNVHENDTSTRAPDYRFVQRKNAATPISSDVTLVE
jgi:hypothetical protein